ncbi:Os10g0566050 [Oryza sativa Japonica Group]|uniref:Os10g0566050 protein n=2 Tax=Oryza sativa subsp. japonica TaxID=39947 RepID=C7J7E5_ORYSJ|nr:Os10g0566050 [Oryza sativa Japonica Group]|eukprot:NP_001176276.1 Os10g0566050 [Oryza sativa Japonica Group]
MIRMDGKTPQKQRPMLIQEFQQTNRWSLFLITTNVGGVGITLTKATRVIVFDPAKNPSNDTQVLIEPIALGKIKMSLCID